MAIQYRFRDLNHIHTLAKSAREKAESQTGRGGSYRRERLKAAAAAYENVATLLRNLKLGDPND